MQSWLPDLAGDAGPKYLAIAAALTRDIEQGRLLAGERLPPQRVLAEQLSIDLTTVTKAYNEVRRIGLIEGDGRLGSFVRGVADDRAVDRGMPVQDTGMNLPPDPEKGTLADRIRAGTQALLARPGSAGLLQYQPSGGTRRDRGAAAAALRARGMEAAEDKVLIASGGQNALHAIVGATLAPVDVVCTGHHVYPGFLAIARRHGLVIEALDGDAEGIDPDALAALCARRRIAAVYVVPTNDNPTTATLGIDRRKAIAAIALRHGLTIIEDDAYGQLPARPLPSIAQFAPEQTWHVASLSKIISPGLRVAWLCAPSVKHAWRLAAGLHETAVMAPPLNAALASIWLNDGSFAALAAEIRAEAVARQNIASAILAPGSYAAHPEGYHLWMALPDWASSAEIVDTLRPAGLSVVPSTSFAVDAAAAPSHLRISIGGSLSREGLGRTLRLLDALTDQGGARRAPLV